MQPKREQFFFYMTLVLIVIVVSGFSVLAFQRPGGPLATPLFLHFHGAVFLGWFVLLATQAGLIGRGSVALHRRLGLASLGYALAIVILGYIVVRGVVQRPDGIIAGRPSVIGAVFPVTDIVNFVIAYGLGLANRGNAPAHKRFMLMSAILMIDAAMARLVLGLGLPDQLILLLELALIGAVLVYDLLKLRRPHWATLTGLALYAAAMTLKLNIEKFAWWPDFMRVLFGAG